MCVLLGGVSIMVADDPAVYNHILFDHIEFKIGQYRALSSPSLVHKLASRMGLLKLMKSRFTSWSQRKYIYEMRFSVEVPAEYLSQRPGEPPLSVAAMALGAVSQFNFGLELHVSCGSRPDTQKVRYKWDNKVCLTPPRQADPRKCRKGECKIPMHMYSLKPRLLVVC